MSTVALELSQEQTNDLVDRIVTAAHPERIILFGSRARKQASARSDVDVLVVVAEGTHRRKAAQDIYRGLLGFGVPVDIVTATPSDLEKYGGSSGLVYCEAIREGCELYAL